MVSLVFILGMMTMNIFSLTYESCPVNPLCSCHPLHHEVICRGVPFSTFPTLRGLDNVYQVTIVRSGLRVLNGGVFDSTSVASLHLMHNNLQVISPKAFRGLENLLTTLDLSNNQLQDIPLEALVNLRQLKWLSLNFNQLLDVQALAWSSMMSKRALHSLFLGGNAITSITEHAFVNLTNLQILDIDNNLIHDVGTRPFPMSLDTLILSNNLLDEVPLHAIYFLNKLRILQLSGNLLKELPTPFILESPNLIKLDFSNNILKVFRRETFNNSLTIKELNLSFNFYKTIPAEAFRRTKLERLFLDNNKLTTLHSDAMAGLENTLKVLDLSFNLLQVVPTAINTLKILLHVSFRGNILHFLDPGDLHGCRNTLEVWDLSGNKFTQIPKATLKYFSRLVRVSLQDNRIEKLHRDDFKHWGKSLRTLSLANNKMSYILSDSFISTPHLRELRLSFNNLIYIDQQAFYPISKSLEILEMSATLSRCSQPIEFPINNLEKLEWLQIDHNNISLLQSSDFRVLRELLHLDVEGNELTFLPASLFNASALKQISTIHLSNNRLDSIKSGTFDGLRQVSNIVIFNNHIRIIEDAAFSNCHYLHTIVLSCNNIRNIEIGAFRNLSHLRNLYLQRNFLETFSLSTLLDVSGPLYINLSRNSLSTLSTTNNKNVEYGDVNVNTLDLSGNNFHVVPLHFLEAISENLVHLFLAYNYIVNVSLPVLPNIQILHLSYNKIKYLDESFDTCCTSVQVLSLNHNKLTFIEEKTFSSMSKLRILDLSNNEIDSVYDNSFDGTKLERLNLSKNRITHPLNSRNLHNLRFLDFSGNFITELSSSNFGSMHQLLVLNLSSNNISTIRKECFFNVPNLLEVDMSSNRLPSSLIYDALMTLRFLRTLHLRNMSLLTVPKLPFPQLQSLDISQNSIANMSQSHFRQLKHLRHFYLSKNAIKDVPTHLWSYLLELTSLDLSHNHISVLGVNSFDGLIFIRQLSINGFPLERLDPRVLHSMRFLTSLSTDSYFSVRSFRLQDLLSHSPAVRDVRMVIQESTLSHQLQGAFGTKLRELTLTGHNFKIILPDAFSGMSTHELTLRIEGTSVARFPDGLLRYLPDIRYLTLDLRNNQLLSLCPEVLTAVSNDTEQTSHISGGVLLENNPWNCTCELLWLGRWLNRWLRETFQVHLLSVEAALYVHTVARKTTCFMPNSNTSHPVIDLRTSDVNCKRFSSNSSVISPICIYPFGFVVVIKYYMRGTWILEI